MVEQTLLALKVAFVVLLYLFIWRVVRVSSRDLSLGQESMVLAPVRPAKPPPERGTGRLVVTRSPELAEGTELAIGHELVAGRDASDIPLGADGYASGRHARFARGIEADVVEDLHSTNGTFVNGERVAGPRALHDGDVVTIGQTQLVYRQ
ncbi:MAG TPA: FHA domain-containing protein [Thermoleophilia bacterium]|nr:FHA domain-containing protein [Thermoleophilia bacterium]